MKDIDKDTLGEALARNTLDDIPQPKSDAKEIIATWLVGDMEEGYKKLKLLIETYKKFKEESKATIWPSLKRCFFIFKDVYISSFRV